MTYELAALGGCMTRRDLAKSLMTGSVAFVTGMFALGCNKKEPPQENDKT